MSCDADMHQELELIRNHRIETECKKGDHNWQHFYAHASCSTCGKDMDITMASEHRNSE